MGNWRSGLQIVFNISGIKLLMVGKKLNNLILLKNKMIVPILVNCMYLKWTCLCVSHQ